MPEKNINNLLLTFKKYGDGTMEVSYLSQAFLNILKDPSSRLDCITIEKNFPTEGRDLFPQLVEGILEKRGLVLPLFLFESGFTWVKTEGHSILQENQELLINILFVPVVLSEIVASWIVAPDSRKVFSHQSNPSSYQYSSLAGLKEYLQDQSKLEPNTGFDPFLLNRYDDALLFKNKKLISKGLKNGFSLVELLEERPNSGPSNHSDKVNIHHSHSENTFSNQLLYRLTEISTLYKGKKLFDEWLKFFSIEFGFKFSIIGDFNTNISKPNILSIFHEGRIKNKLNSKWEKLVDFELETTKGEAKPFLLRNHILDEKIFPNIYRELKVCSSIYMDLFDQKNGKIGFLCFFNDHPIDDTLSFKPVFNLLGNWLGKEMSRFKLEFALQESNFMHDAILNGTAYAIFAVNQDHQIVLINDNTLPVFNLKSKDNLMETCLVKGEKSFNLSEIVKDF
ncbi:MAG: hypothetical protein WDZ72_07675, partial [Cyclobacteriaceae bacterium]